MALHQVELSEVLVDAETKQDNPNIPAAHFVFVEVLARVDDESADLFRRKRGNHLLVLGLEVLFSVGLKGAFVETKNGKVQNPQVSLLVHHQVLFLQVVVEDVVVEQFPHVIHEDRQYSHEKLLKNYRVSL